MLGADRVQLARHVSATAKFQGGMAWEAAVRGAASNACVRP
jgi:hypothetical protein